MLAWALHSLLAPDLPCWPQVTSCTGVPAPFAATCAATLASKQVTYDGAPAYYSASACVHQPGNGWVTTALSSTVTTTFSAPCPRGFWSPGGHNQSCTACPLSLLTLNEGSTSLTDCGECCCCRSMPVPHCCQLRGLTVFVVFVAFVAVAPPGFRLSVDLSAAVECGDGYYQDTYTSATSCTACGTSPAAIGGLWKSDRLIPLIKTNPSTGAVTTVNVRGNSSACCEFHCTGKSRSPACRAPSCHVALASHAADRAWRMLLCLCRPQGRPGSHGRRSCCCLQHKQLGPCSDKVRHGWPAARLHLVRQLQGDELQHGDRRRGQGCVPGRLGGIKEPGYGWLHFRVGLQVSCRLWLGWRRGCCMPHQHIQRWRQQLNVCRMPDGPDNRRPYCTHHSDRMR